MRKGIVKTLTGVMTLAMVLTTAVVVSPEKVSAKKVTVKKVTAVAPSGKTAYVAKGKKVKITTTVKVAPNKKANKKVTYKSANKKIATVTSKGVIKGVKAGKTKITITSKKNKKKKTTMKVVVKKAAVKKIKLNSGSFVLQAGGKKTLKATVSPTKNVSKKIAWTSSNKKVATVSSKGVVKGIADGKATITAKATDGSNKKATVTVTVGSGIASVTVPASRVVRVTLSGAKKLSAKDFVIQTKTSPSATRYTSVPVAQVSTKDQKVYDINVETPIYAGSYVKVTIGALATNKSAEIYVDYIAGYGTAGNETISYVTAMKGEKYSSQWSAENDNQIGVLSYTSVTGLPSGLKAYISKDLTEVYVAGVFNSVENGTKATVLGVDEKGRTFSREYIFYVGSESQLVAGTEPAYTGLSYTPDNPATIKDEECGYDLNISSNITKFLYVSGGSEDYTYSVTCNGKSLYDLTHDSNGDRIANPAGTYNFIVEVTDDENENLKISAAVTINLVNGVTVSGTVRDAAGQIVKNATVYGYTKSDAYGRYYSMSAYTEVNGTYSTRVMPGDYYTYCYCNGSHDITVGNNFTGNATKDFALPLYRVNFNLNVPGAVAYGFSDISVIDSYGEVSDMETYSSYENFDGDYSLYAYLKPGTYDVCASTAESSSNTVDVYGKIYDETSEGIKYYYRAEYIGTYKVSGSFTVSGNGTVTLNGTKYLVQN